MKHQARDKADKYYSTPQNSDHLLSSPKLVTLSVDYESKT